MCRKGKTSWKTRFDFGLLQSDFAYVVLCWSNCGPFNLATVLFGPHRRCRFQWLQPFWKGCLWKDGFWCPFVSTKLWAKKMGWIKVMHIAFDAFCRLRSKETTAFGAMKSARATYKASWYQCCLSWTRCCLGQCIFLIGRRTLGNFQLINFIFLRKPKDTRLPTQRSWQGTPSSILPETSIGTIPFLWTPGWAMLSFLVFDLL